MGHTHRDGQVAAYDIPFIDGTDSRLQAQGFTNVEQLAFIRLWAVAVKHRRHLLPPEYDAKTHVVLASLLQVHRKCAQEMVRKCTACGLIKVVMDGENARILVVGVGVKHHWLTFYDSPDGAETPSKGGENAPQGSRLKVEGSRRESAEAKIEETKQSKYKDDTLGRMGQPRDKRKWVDAVTGLPADIDIQNDEWSADPMAWRPDHTNGLVEASRWPVGRVFP